jgi:hypothetical protein
VEVWTCLEEAEEEEVVITKNIKRRSLLQFFYAAIQFSFDSLELSKFPKFYFVPRKNPLLTSCIYCMSTGSCMFSNLSPSTYFLVPTFVCFSRKKSAIIAVADESGAHHSFNWTTIISIIVVH